MPTGKNEEDEELQEGYDRDYNPSVITDEIFELSP
jgi:hypothetical protein